jgi:hypothetical protein
MTKWFIEFSYQNKGIITADRIHFISWNFSVGSVEQIFLVNRHKKQDNRQSFPHILNL